MYLSPYNCPGGVRAPSFVFLNDVYITQTCELETRLALLDDYDAEVLIRVERLSEREMR